MCIRDSFQSCAFFEQNILPLNMPALLYAFKAARLPYQEPKGPEVVGAALSAAEISAGTPVTLTGVADDSRYDSNGYGNEPVQNVAAARFSVRATESDFSFQVVDKVVACAEASAAAMGATVKVSHERHYANRIPNLVMARLFAENIGSLGENVQTPDANERRGSSDMGNVSQILPAIHPYVTIAPPGIGGHTPEFAAAAASPWGHQALIRSAKALAMTAVDLFTQPELLAEAKSEFARTVNPDAAWRKKKFFA